jgi:hypothetical protein
MPFVNSLNSSPVYALFANKHANHEYYAIREWEDLRGWARTDGTLQPHSQHQERARFRQIWHIRTTKAIVDQFPGQGVFGGGEVGLFSQYFPSKTRRKEITNKIRSKNLSRRPRLLAYHDKKGQVDDRVSRPRTLP